MSKKLSRRALLRTAAAGTCGGVLHRLFTPSPNLMAFGQEGDAARSVLIVINLNGGASYNMCPLYSAAYRGRNRTISAGPENSLPLSNDQGLHRALSKVHQLFLNGDGALLNLVGYPNPDFSHAGSQEVWFRGTRSMSSDGSGWAARMTCQMAAESAGYSLFGSNNLTSGSCRPPVAIPSLDALASGDVFSQYTNVPVSSFRERLLSEAPEPQSPEGRLVLERMRSSIRAASAIRESAGTVSPDDFPQTEFGRMCQDAARLILSPSLGVRFLYLEKSGFDTHTNEVASLQQLLSDLDAGVGALAAELKKGGRWADVTLVTMSEFSRTFENASGGSDHGHAAPMLVLGGAVRGGILTPAPTASAMRQFDYFRDYQVDFRQPFYEIATHMGLPADVIFPERISFSSLNLFRA